MTTVLVGVALFIPPWDEESGEENQWDVFINKVKKALPRSVSAQYHNEGSGKNALLDQEDQLQDDLKSGLRLDEGYMVWCPSDDGIVYLVLSRRQGNEADEDGSGGADELTLPLPSSDRVTSFMTWARKTGWMPDKWVEGTSNDCRIHVVS